ncbi:MAG: SDR family oxidoreductase [Bacteroidetes bacterium]|nr:SDR family oxidoreductase [Bacteroidota bacterium]MBU1485533.1 SDR family oxidoreductase [Bacteroidota bacterium]MBU2269559.1 SDR family oxidoreductase [Bacteroidota bacterium]MBU2375250.1 SDR family oxidoreductase [Bacteroidota bacterium]
MKKKKVLITGASRGLGLAIAKRIYQEYDLILHATREESFTEIPPNSQLLCADFSDKEQVANFCKELKKNGDHLYGIINNAGVTFDKPLTFQPEKDIDMMLQINLKTPMLICKTAMKIFGLNKKGVIINVSSVVGETGNAFQSIYAATKAGLVAFSKSLAKEAGMLNNDHEIRVLSISPGFLSSDMTDKIPETEKEKYLKMIPSQRFGKVEEIAETIAFLLSEKAAYINGSDIKINGGII